MVTGTGPAWIATVRRAARKRSNTSTDIDDVGARQELAQRQEVVELPCRHPALFDDQHAARPRQNAAEAHERDPDEGEEDLDQRTRCNRSGGGRDGQRSIGRFLGHGATPGTDGRRPLGATQAPYSLQPLLPSSIRAYIGWAGLPAMAINGRRNKPFGPGGSTRRLHQFQGSEVSDQNQPIFLIADHRSLPTGAKQDRRGRKGRAFARYGSAVIGPLQ
jgi:hypothetical protein